MIAALKNERPDRVAAQVEPKFTENPNRDLSMNSNNNSNFPVIVEAKIAGAVMQTVNARDLHAFLGVKSQFRDWIKNRIDDFSFTENVDFTTAIEIYRGGERKEYHITLDMGKELAMVERTPKGKEVRQYFIECERAARGVVTLRPLDRAARETRLFMRQALQIAGLAGLAGNQRLIAANRSTRKATGFDYLAEMGVSHLEAPQQEVLLTATDIGKKLGTVSAIRVNHLLAEHGFQIGGRSHTGHTYWEPTEKGIKAGGVMVDVERSNKTGQARQLRWASRIVPVLRQIISGEVA